MDVVEVIWGSSMFYALYDDPQLVKALLELVTETYIAFLRAWERIVPFESAGNTHWGFFHGGSIMLRDDSAMNVSPEQFDEFIRPYDQRLLEEFGGGAVHFCGRGSHYIPSLCEMRKLYAIHLSQPEYNDMETIYANTVDKGIKILGLRRQTAEEALKAGRDFHGCVHVH
jgi:uroporphyrinogen-III decarboxylase